MWEGKALLSPLATPMLCPPLGNFLRTPLLAGQLFLAHALSSLFTLCCSHFMLGFIEL